MPLAHLTEMLSVSDAKIRLLTADPAGGTATYGSWVDLPDITSVTLEGDTDVKERHGDGVVRSRRQVLTGLTLTIENTVLAPDVLALLEGGTVVDSGTTPNQKWTYTYDKNSKPKYVQFEAQCTETSYAGGDVHLVVYKASLNNKVPFGFSDDEFQTFSYELGAVARNADDKYFDIVANETAVAVA